MSVKREVIGFHLLPATISSILVTNLLVTGIVLIASGYKRVGSLFLLALFIAELTWYYFVFHFRLQVFATGWPYVAGMVITTSINALVTKKILRIKRARQMRGAQERSMCTSKSEFGRHRQQICVRLAGFSAVDTKADREYAIKLGA